MLKKSCSFSLKHIMSSGRKFRVENVDMLHSLIALSKDCFNYSATSRLCFAGVWPKTEQERHAIFKLFSKENKSLERAELLAVANTSKQINLKYSYCLFLGQKQYCQHKHRNHQKTIHHQDYGH